MAKKLLSKRFPGESEDYRRARNQLLQAEIKLRRQTEAVAAQRRRLPLGGEVRTDYAFEAWKPGTTGFKSVKLSGLFAPGKNTLFLYNFMFPAELGSITPCPSCTSILDAVDGAALHVTQQINFAVVAKAPIAKFRAHARKRGWRNALFLSSVKNDFNRAYSAEGPEGEQFPIAHVFVKRGKKIHHVWSSELFFAKSDPGQDMRHVDFIWPMWSMFDVTPDGRGKDWGPRLQYS